MAKITKIITFIGLILLFVGSLMASLAALFGAGWLSSENFSTKILLGTPIFTLIGLVFFIKTLRSFQNVSSTKHEQVRNLIWCLIFFVISILIPYTHEWTWCLEAQLKGIGLLPGHCWYN